MPRQLEKLSQNFEKVVDSVRRNRLFRNYPMGGSRYSRDFRFLFLRQLYPVSELTPPSKLGSYFKWGKFGWGLNDESGEENHEGGEYTIG
jgi:hypothetical protein